MKKVIAVFALAAFIGAATAQTTQPKPAAKKEACCKKKDGKMECKKDCKYLPPTFLYYFYNFKDGKEQFDKKNLYPGTSYTYCGGASVELKALPKGEYGIHMFAPFTN